MQNQIETEVSQWTILNVLKWTTSYFRSHNIEQPRADAEILLSRTLNLQRVDLYLRYDQPLSADERSRFKTLIKRRINREPVAYIIGTKEFWTIDLMITPDVLIPRPETECLVEMALSLLPEAVGKGAQTILDMGTGSGAIILSLASERRHHRFFASDRSQAAVRLARRNAVRHGMEQRVTFFAVDWLAAFKPDEGLFDMIVSNPPYVRSGDVPGLQPEIYRFEPIEALDGGEDGLDAIRSIIDQARKYLKPNGHLLLEIGYDQKRDVRQIIDDSGRYGDVRFAKDYSGYDRVVKMTKKG
jgi:release factor glutamine methyltransferase